MLDRAPGQHQRVAAQNVVYIRTLLRQVEEAIAGGDSPTLRGLRQARQASPPTL